MAACSDPAASTDASADVADDEDSAPSTDIDDAAADPFVGHVARIELGKHITNTDGYASPIDLALPIGATSVVITVDGPPGVFFNIASLASSSGLSIVPKAWISFSPQPMACLSSCPNRVIAQPGTASFLVPNTPLVKLPAGLRFRVYAFERDGKAYPPREASFTAWAHVVRKTAKQRMKGRVALNIGATGALGLSKSTILKDPRVAKAIKTARSVFAQAGIELEPINAFDAAKIPLIARQNGAKAELTKLFWSGKSTGMGVNVFLVDKVLAAVQSGPGANVLSGVSGGVPGPPLVVGTTRSGIALSLDLAPGQPDTLGRTLAHELAHFLGLFHTVEDPTFGAMISDELPDTGAESDNLMHWSVSDTSQVLTSQQRHILHSNPWVIPVSE